MEEQKSRSMDEIMEDLQRINREFREKIQEGFRDPDSFMRLSEIERMGQELSCQTQKLYLEETAALLDGIDEGMLLRKKKHSTSPSGST